MTAINPDASRQAVVEAALVLLERMGLTPGLLIWSEIWCDVENSKSFRSSRD